MAVSNRPKSLLKLIRNLHCGSHFFHGGLRDGAAFARAFFYNFVDSFGVIAIVIAAVADWGQEFFERLVKALFYFDVAYCALAIAVFQFLNFRHLRAITVGSKRLWVWDKSAATLSVVKKLGAWADQNMVAEVNRLMKTHPHTWQDPYVKLALKNLGFPWPKRLEEWEANWEKMLRTILKIKVRVFPREDGAGSG